MLETDSLSVKEMIGFCDTSIERETRWDDEDRTSQVQNYEHEMALWRNNVEHARENAKTINEAAFQALRSLVFTSAGMAGAFLAFLGSIWDKVEPAARPLGIEGLMYFSFALVGGVICYGFTYLFHFMDGELDMTKGPRHVRVAAIGLVIAAYCFIGAGLWHSALMLWHSSHWVAVK